MPRTPRLLRPLPAALLALAAALLAPSVSPGAARWELLAGPDDPPPFSGRAVHDSRRQRLVFLEGLNPGEVWTLSLPAVGTPAWRRVFVRGPLPPTRFEPTTVYDSLADRVLMFGGDGAQAYDDVWALELDADPPAWTELHPQAGPPPPRRGAVAVFDPVANRLVVWGGRSHGYQPDHFPETWSLELSGTPRWQRVEAAREPGPYREARAAYDPWNRRMLLHTGRTVPTRFGGQEFREDVWALALSEPMTWDSLPAPPGLRGYGSHVALVDPLRRELISGCGLIRTPVELWALNLEGPPEWRTHATRGELPGELSPFAVVSPERASVIQFHPQACYELDLAAGEWSRFSVPEPAVFPPRRARASMALDAGAGALFVFEGYDWGCRHDLYRFDLGAGRWEWEELPVVGGPANCAPIRGEWLHGVPAHDPVGGRLLECFGSDLVGHFLDEVWALPLASPWAWSRLDVSGPAPPGRFDYALLIDPPRRRLLLFGGAYRHNRTDDMPTDLGDLWAFSLDSLRWTQLPVPPGPSPRRGATLLLDARRDRLLLVGGARSIYRGTLPVLDAWSLPLGDPGGGWAALADTLPAAAAAVLDPNRDRLLLWDQARGLWSLPLSAPGPWQPVEMAGKWPVERAFANVAFDPRRDQLVTFGGAAYESEHGLRADLHALRFSRPVAVERLGSARAAATPRPGATIVAAILSAPDFSPDSVLVSSVTLAGARAIEEVAPAVRAVRRDLNRDGRPDLVLEFPVDAMDRAEGDTAAVLIGRTPGFEILGHLSLRADGRGPESAPGWKSPGAGGGSPRGFGLWALGPADGRPRLRFALASEAPARLEVFDLAGRRIATRDLSGGAPRIGTLVLDEAALLPGVYLARLTQGARTAVARAVVLRRGGGR